MEVLNTYFLRYIMHGFDQIVRIEICYATKLAVEISRIHSETFLCLYRIVFLLLSVSKITGIFIYIIM